MTADKQFVEKFKAILFAGKGGVCTDVFFCSLFDRFRSVCLDVHCLRQKLLVHTAKLPECQESVQGCQTGQYAEDHNGCGNGKRQQKTGCGRRIREHNQQSHDQPGQLSEPVFICDGFSFSL